jgi:hypothetical protein
MNGTKETTCNQMGEKGTHNLASFISVNSSLQKSMFIVLKNPKVVVVNNL